MRAVFGAVLAAGVLLAVGAVYMFNNHLNQYKVALQEERAITATMVKTVPVFVAADTLEYGSQLTPSNIREVQFPEDAVPEGAFSSHEEIFSEGDKVLRSVIRQMEKDEAILALKVTEPGQDAGIGSRLGPDFRAFALKVDVTSGVSGLLRAGDIVDVYWTGRPPRGEHEITRLIQPSIEIVAIDQDSDNNASRGRIARTVTIATHYKNIGSLISFQSSGRLSLSLVGNGEFEVADVPDVDQKTLLGIEDIVPEAAPVEEEVCTIKTRKGSETVDMVIPCTN